MSDEKDLTIKEAFDLAIQNHKNNNLQEAQNYYQKVLKIDPNLAVVHNNLGIIFKELGEIQKAQSCYEKAIKGDPNFAEPYHNLGFLFQCEGDIQKAKSYYEKAIKYDPNLANSYHNLGSLLQSEGDIQKAKSYYEKAIESDPNFVESYNNLQSIFPRIKDIKNSYKNHVKFFQLKSKDIVSNAKLENVIPRFVKKLQNQNGIPTFFDTAVNFHLTKKMNPDYDFCEIFEKVQNSKENRFVSHSTRIKDASKSEPNNKSHQEPLFLSSQGTHSLIKWKEKPLYKTAFDLVIYSMILQEVKPDVIIELGSGLGGSAIWLADTASMLGLDTHVYSFDINKPMFKHNKVTFIEQDLTKINLKNKPQYWELFNGKKVIIEDAHVNLKDILNLFDSIIRKDDYLIIEDSNKKQNIISNFSNEKEPKYKLDQFFLDFFGTNMTCCTNSIFKCY